MALPLAILVWLVSPLLYQEKTERELQRGVNFLDTTVYPDDENRRTLKLFEGLRVADVSDGMDMAGLPGTGLVDPAIHPDWIDRNDLSHQR